jgi:tRNA G18 (ribose-2'-O)-methylase SpoU
VLRVRNIESLELPELAPYRTMRQQADHYQQRLFVAEGEKVVRRLLGSDLEILSLLMPAEHLPVLRPLLETRPEVVEVYLGDKPLLETLTGFSMYQGLLACARIPPPAELDVAFALAQRPRFLVAMDALANAENLGAVVRNAAAFGVHAMIVGETCAHPYLRRAVRASMGTIFDMLVTETVSLPGALRELRRRGVRCVAADPHHEGRFLPLASLATDCCIVLGSEGTGLSAAVRQACDECVAVPMQGGVDSLNVGAAAAVFFYEVWRQRQIAARP